MKGTPEERLALRRAQNYQGPKWPRKRDHVVRTDYRAARRLAGLLAPALRDYLTITDSNWINVRRHLLAGALELADDILKQPQAKEPVCPTTPSP